MNYNELINKSKEYGFSDLEIYEDRNSELTISIYNGNVEKNNISDATQITIRGIYNGKMSSMILENNNESIEFILNNLRTNAQIISTEEEFSIYEGDAVYPKAREIKNDFQEYTTYEKIEMLKGLEKEVKSLDSRVAFVPYCNYEESKTTIRIINSKGLNIEKGNEYCALVLQAVARENNDSQSGFKVDVQLKYENLDVKKLATEVVERTVSMLNARSIPSKVYPVIIENEAMTDLLSAYFSAFSGEAAIKKITPFLGKENEKIMSDLITIVDNPLREDAILNAPFDDEGVACSEKVIVDKGVLKTLLHNLKTAKYFNTKSTGNGFKRGATIDVSGANFYIEPGIKTKKELIQQMNEGLLLTGVEGLHAGVNPISGDFSLKAQGFLVTEGKIDRPITLIVASGNFYKLMNAVVAVGNDLELGYQGIATPSILFNGLAISGE